jgi:hypothetical protein
MLHTCEHGRMTTKEWRKMTDNQNAATKEAQTSALSWEVKDAARGYWQISATPHPAEDNPAEPNSETWWNVIVESSHDPYYYISFTATTQLDQPITLKDIWREMMDHMMLFTAAALEENAKRSA